MTVMPEQGINPSQNVEAFVTEDNLAQGLQVPVDYDVRGAFVSLAAIEIARRAISPQSDGRLYIQNTKRIVEDRILCAGKGDIIIDTDALMVHVREKLITFSVKEYGMLTFLARRLGQIVTREELLEKVWNTPMVSVQQSRTIDTHAKTIRHKLGKDDLGDPNTGVLLAAINRGYVLL